MPPFCRDLCSRVGGGLPSCVEGSWPPAPPSQSPPREGERLNLWVTLAERRSQSAQLSPILPPLGEKAHILLRSSMRSVLQGQTLTGPTLGVRCEQTCLPSRPQPYCPESVVVVIKVIFISASATVLCLSRNRFSCQSPNRNRWHAQTP